MKTIVFFNNKGGVGKTSLVYHLAWMYSDLGVPVVAADLDPQANLTAMFLSEDRLLELWPDGDHPQTILGAVSPILDGVGDIATPHVEAIGDNRGLFAGHLGLVSGDLGLARFEAKLSEAWPKCVDRDKAAFRTTSAFYRVLLSAANQRGAECVLIDVGPNLGAINRAAIIAANYVVVPIAADLYSIQGLKNLGPTLQDWRREWKDRLDRKPRNLQLDLPPGEMHPAGYVILQHAVRLDRPVKAYERWMSRIPGVYHSDVLQHDAKKGLRPEDDDACLASLKHYRSLMPLAQDALKPMFHLKSADGALGAHLAAVQLCYAGFADLARKIASVCGLQAVGAQRT